MITYNHGDFLRDAIHGVLMQEADFPIELVLSNDHSPDDTHALIQDIVSEHPRGSWIQYIHHPQTLGMMRNGLDNLQRCRGDYIAFCEGDDAWTDPLKLQIQVTEMQKHPDCDLCFHPARVFFGRTKTDSLYAFHSHKPKVFSASEVLMGGCDFCPTASLLLKKSIIDQLPDFYAEAPVGDYFLKALGSLQGGALYLNRVMSIYRRNTSFSWTAEMQALQNRATFFSRFVDSLQKLDKHLQHILQKEIHFEIERQYRNLAITYLEHGLHGQYKTLFDLYKNNHISRTRIWFFYYLGKITKSPKLTHFLERVFFCHPNPFKRAYRKAIQKLHLKRYQKAFSIF
jgi:glycosyltransferase involved in cell wall biosynthesis